MRLILCLVTSLLLLSTSVDAQQQKRPKTIRWADWSDSVAFQNGPIPLLQDYGPHSDSLSNVYGGIFYLLDNQYFQIKNAADYYLWFTKRYDFLFRGDVETYSLFYLAGDNLSMATFIAENYKGKRLPIKIGLYLPSRTSTKDQNKEKLANRRQQKEYDKNVTDPVKLSKPTKKN